MDAKTLGEQPAYPRDHAHDGHNGITLRQHYAGLAMHALIASGRGLTLSPKGISIEALVQADSMLAELAKEPK